MALSALPVDLSPLSTILEKEKELSKSELLRRAAGKVNERLLQYLRQFQFCSINKSENGTLYLL